MQDLKVTIIQADLIWEQVEKNLAHFDTKLASLNKNTDLIILPEMFSTGFSMNARKLAEPVDGPTLHWLKEKAAEKEADITGSIIVNEDDAYYNRLYWVKPDGAVQTYDKAHLFRMARENDVYTAGRQKNIVDCKDWKICPLICYDVRFPVWSRNRNNEYDLVIYIANWPERRAEHWISLLKARAIENQAFVIGVNRVGKDGMGINYSGDSMIIDPPGTVLCHKRGNEAVHTERLSASTLNNYRQKFPVWMDGDDFEILK